MCDYANQNTKQYADVLILKRETRLKSTTGMQHVQKWLGSGSVDGEGKVGEERRDFNARVESIATAAGMSQRQRGTLTRLPRSRDFSLSLSRPCSLSATLK